MFGNSDKQPDTLGEDGMNETIKDGVDENMNRFQSEEVDYEPENLNVVNEEELNKKVDAKKNEHETSNDLKECTGFLDIYDPGN